MMKKILIPPKKAKRVKIKAQIYMVDFNPNISVFTLNAHGLNAPVKREIFSIVFLNSMWTYKRHLKQRS